MTAGDAPTPCPLCDGSTIDLGEWPVLAGARTGLRRCESCGSMFRHPMPADEAVAEYYDQLTFDAGGRAIPRRIKKARMQAIDIGHHIQALGMDRSARILDLGAGVGAVVAALRDLGYANVSGIEPRAAAVEFARERFGVELVRGVATDAAGHVDTQPDVLVLGHLLEHLPAPADLLDELKRSFPGSVVWIECPDGDYESAAANGRAVHRLWYDQHLWSFTVAGLVGLLRASGLQVLSAVCEVCPFTAGPARMLELSIALARKAGVSRFRLLPQAAPWKLLKGWNRFCRAVRLHDLPDSPFALRAVARL